MEISDSFFNIAITEILRELVQKMINVCERMGHYRRDVVVIKMVLIKMKNIIAELGNSLSGFISRFYHWIQ